VTLALKNSWTSNAQNWFTIFDCLNRLPAISAPISTRTTKAKVVDSGYKYLKNGSRKTNATKGSRLSDIRAKTQKPTKRDKKKCICQILSTIRRSCYLSGSISSWQNQFLQRETLFGSSPQICPLFQPLQIARTWRCDLNLRLRNISDEALQVLCPETKNIQ